MRIDVGNKTTLVRWAWDAQETLTIWVGNFHFPYLQNQSSTLWSVCRCESCVSKIMVKFHYSLGFLGPLFPMFASLVLGSHTCSVGEILATMNVLLLPPNESRSSHVSTEFLYDTNVFLERLKIT